MVLFPRAQGVVDFRLTPLVHSTLRDFGISTSTLSFWSTKCWDFPNLGQIGRWSRENRVQPGDETEVDCHRQGQRINHAKGRFRGGRDKERIASGAEGSDLRGGSYDCRTEEEEAPQHIVRVSVSCILGYFENLAKFVHNLRKLLSNSECSFKHLYFQILLDQDVLP